MSTQVMVVVLVVALSLITMIAVMMKSTTKMNAKTSDDAKLQSRVITFGCVSIFALAVIFVIIARQYLLTMTAL